MRGNQESYQINFNFNFSSLSCLVSSLCYSLRPESNGLDPPHAKIASDVMSCIFLVSPSAPLTMPVGMASGPPEKNRWRTQPESEPEPEGSRKAPKFVIWCHNFDIIFLLPPPPVCSSSDRTVGNIRPAPPTNQESFLSRRTTLGAA